ncbi:signal peptidase I [Angustibacter sp. McL0619]|uniref:signal peptidase I n=1 Tax=Angustibacter sp. McL0619 TaxID=3415676 RepID=UPI003CFB1542
MDVARGDAAAAAAPAADPAEPPAVADAIAGTTSRRTPLGGRLHSGNRAWWQELPVLAATALVLTLLVRTFLVQAFYIPSGSMEPTLNIGDRVLVSKLSYRLGDVQRGDVIVFDGRDSFAGAGEVEPARGVVAKTVRGVGAFFGVSASEKDFTKRVIGLPGDRVVCCDAAGRVSVNGVAIDEPYVMPGDAPSDSPFDVVVPPGRLWVMGDHRSDSADSRSHLGDPGGGTVPVDRVIGKVVLRFWPLDHLGGVGNDGADSP